MTLTTYGASEAWSGQGGFPLPRAKAVEQPLAGSAAGQTDRRRSVADWNSFEIMQGGWRGGISWRIGGGRHRLFTAR